MVKEYETIVNMFLSKIRGARPRLGNLYLFGSRAKGTARPDSDYDILLLVDQKDAVLKSELYDAAVDVQLETGADISLKIVLKKDFDRMVDLGAPFAGNILKEGIKLG